MFMIMYSIFVCSFWTRELLFTYIIRIETKKKTRQIAAMINDVLTKSFWLETFKTFCKFGSIHAYSIFVETISSLMKVTL